MTDYDVIICGLGPVGQLLALLLGDRGVRTLALDREPEPYLLPRAAVIDDEVLRIFQSVGLDEAVLADAQIQPGASIITACRPPRRDLPLADGPARPPAAGLDQPAGDGAHDARRARAQAERRRPPRAHARGARPAGRPRRRLRAADRRRAFGAHLGALAGRLRRRHQRGAGPPGDPARGLHQPAALGRRRRARRPAAAQGAAPALRRRREAPDGDAADVTRPPPLGVDAAPRRGRRAAPRAGRRAGARSRNGSTARASRSSARSPTRSTRAWPPAGAAAACCWRATRRT